MINDVYSYGYQNLAWNKVLNEKGYVRYVYISIFYLVYINYIQMLVMKLWIVYVSIAHLEMKKNHIKHDWYWSVEVICCNGFLGQLKIEWYEPSFFLLRCTIRIQKIDNTWHVQYICSKPTKSYFQNEFLLLHQDNQLC